ncbi:MAG: hypothetical protein GY943_23835 [Chloroflexi bacterium]|nr:hypothetical protein [Chloroflexota bacterium]
MSQNEAAWDYCTIQLKIINDGRDPSYAGQKLMWLQFSAQANGGNGRYLAGESTKLPIMDMVGATYTPDKNNVGHKNILDNLLQKLERDGWKRQSFKGTNWWERKMKRPSHLKKKRFWQK